ncbi:uncharacterized protein EMH_0030040 [Eimeria mitis]|uniref:Uncharacterized protein n=1 Tax=Eimeria mitis TaxID=44415 RepID=U6JT73_9EIME|nr:uncharacterized protein EMH_0030040 [Eimeria mitis]CDJ27247.1 hypothetical protein EMH_0030040 [Eimeria mitis]
MLCLWRLVARASASQGSSAWGVVLYLGVVAWGEGFVSMSITFEYARDDRRYRGVVAWGEAFVSMSITFEYAWDDRRYRAVVLCGEAFVIRSFILGMRRRTQGERYGVLERADVLQLRRARGGVECVLFGGRRRCFVAVERLGKDWV